MPKMLRRLPQTIDRGRAPFLRLYLNEQQQERIINEQPKKRS